MEIREIEDKVKEKIEGESDIIELMLIFEELEK